MRLKPEQIVQDVNVTEWNDKDQQKSKSDDT